MKRSVLLIIFFLLLFGGGYWINDPGYILVRFGGFIAEATFWGGIFVAIASFLVLYFFYTLLDSFWRGGSRLIGWAGYLKQKEATELEESAALAALREDWPAAAKYLLKADRLKSLGFLGNLGLAHAAFKAGDFETRNSALSATEAAFPNKSAAISSVSVAWLLEADKSKQAVEILEPLYLKAKISEQQLILLAKAYVREMQFSQVQKIWPALEKQKLLTESGFGQDFGALWAARMINQSKPADAIKVLPKSLKADKQILTQWLDFLVLQNDERALAAAIEAALNHIWDENWIKLFCEVRGPDIEAQFAQAKKWLKLRPKNPYLLFALGGLAASLEQLEVARGYYESALSQTFEENDYRKALYRELGRISHALGDAPRAVQYFLKT
jgi:heme biosynthesis-associated TPR repeat protein